MMNFNYARIPDSMVREQMDRLMADIAPAIAVSYIAIQASPAATETRADHR